MTEVADQSCIFCKFFVSETGTGDCRRHAPFVTGGLHNAVETVWPQVGEAEFCGDFEAKGGLDPEDEDEAEAVAIGRTYPDCRGCENGTVYPADTTADFKCPNCGRDTIIPL